MIFSVACVQGTLGRDPLGQPPCFRGVFLTSPSVIFSVTLFPGLVRLRFSLSLRDPVSGTSSSAIFSVTLFPGRNWGSVLVLSARHGKKRHTTLRTTDPLVVLNWRPSEINVWNRGRGI